ncbi:MAG: metalloregulator ArsR/SmtB family transcription factor [Acidimicrobiales bacterium]
MSTFAVLAEPNRRLILDLLRSGDRTVNDLVAALPLAQPTVSKHLKTLREAGLVQVLPDAQRRVYRLRADGLREIDAWLAPYRTFWAERLDALEAHLDSLEEHDGSAGPPAGSAGSTGSAVHTNQGERI